MTASIDMSKYLDLFVCETREHLEAIEEELARLLGAPGDAPRLHELFRHAHSIKGMASSMGYVKIAELAHGVEHVFEDLKSGALVFDATAHDVAARAFDLLGRLVERVEEGRGAPDAGDDIAPLLEELAALRAAPRALARAADPDDPLPEARLLRVETFFSDGAALASARAAVALKRLASLGRVRRCEPLLGGLERGEFDGRLVAEVWTDEPESGILAAIERVADVVSVRIEPIEETPEEDGSEGESVGAPADGQTAGPPGGTHPGAAPRADRAGASVRVSAATLDRFLDSITDLILQRNRIEARIRGRIDRETDHELERLRRLTRRLHRDVMALRLFPFETIASRFARSVRELGASLRKSVSLTVQGGEVLMDRALLEAIVDPINHILRNAVDHGVERAHERAAAGKPLGATIRIAAARAGDSVRIRIEDDGRGIDAERLKRAAIEKGLVAREALLSMSEAETLLLATLPGVSTAEPGGEISGRGVGMDVVRTRVEALGGRLTLRSSPGEGTCVEMRLPMTIAVLPAFMIESCGRVWAVPLRSVDRAVRFRPEAVVRAEGRDFLITRSGQVPLVDLPSALDLAGGSAPYARARHTLVASEGERSIAVAFERILGRREIVVRPLGRPLEAMREFSGATLLEDGRIALILDLLNLSGV